MGKPRTATLVLKADAQKYQVQLRMPLDDVRVMTGNQKFDEGDCMLVEGGRLEYSGCSMRWESGSECTAEQFIRRLIHHLHRYNVLMCKRHDIHHSDLTRPVCQHVLQRCFGEIRVSRRTREGGTWKSRGSYTLCQLI